MLDIPMVALFQIGKIDWSTIDGQAYIHMHKL